MIYDIWYPCVREINRWPVVSPYRDQWCGNRFHVKTSSCTETVTIWGAFQKHLWALKSKSSKFQHCIKSYQCMSEIFCVEFQSCPLEFHTFFLPKHWKMHILYTDENVRTLRFKSSYAFLKLPPRFHIYVGGRYGRGLYITLLLYHALFHSIFVIAPWHIKVSEDTYMGLHLSRSYMYYAIFVLWLRWKNRFYDGIQ